MCSFCSVAGSSCRSKRWLHNYSVGGRRNRSDGASSQCVQCLQCGWQQLLVAECWRHSAYLQALAPQLQKGRMEQSLG